MREFHDDQQLRYPERDPVVVLLGVLSNGYLAQQQHELQARPEWQAHLYLDHFRRVAR